MGRQPCCDKVGLKKGPWTADEDKKLMSFLRNNAHCCWRAVPKLAGLLRCGKSCRLRWINYLRPDLKRGVLSDSEEQIIVELHSRLGNRWSKIATYLPGRTDNEIKNYWNTHIKKKLRRMGIDPSTHRSIRSPEIQAAPPDGRLPSSTTSEVPQDVLLLEELETCQGSSLTSETNNNKKKKPIKNTIRREFTVNGGKRECTVTTSNESEISCIFEDERSIDSIKRAELGSGCGVQAMPFEQRPNISYLNDADPQTEDYQKLNDYACRSSDFAGDHMFHPKGESESEGSMLIMRSDDSLWEFADLDKLAAGSKYLMKDIDQWSALDPPPPSTFSVQPVPNAEIASTGANSEPLQWVDDGSTLHMLGEGSILTASSHESNYGAQPWLPQAECISFPVWEVGILDHYGINTSNPSLLN